MPTNDYAGRVHVVYRAEPEDVSAPTHIFTEGRAVAMFDSKRGAENYIAEREKNDAFHGRESLYSIVPWLVQR